MSETIDQFTQKVRNCYSLFMNTLKMPMWSSAALNGRTENTMATEKRQRIIVKALHRKLKIEPTKTQG